MTPSLSAPSSEHYPSHLMKGRKPLSNTIGPAGDRAFDVSGGTMIGPVLDRLKSFWNDRKNGDSQPPSPPANDESYFPHANASLSPTPAVTPVVTPGEPTRKMTKEEKAAMAEKARGGAIEVDENGGKGGAGAAWWLDIMCPTVADLRELRKVSFSF